MPPNPFSVGRYLDAARSVVQIGATAAAIIPIMRGFNSKRPFSDLRNLNIIFPNDLERFGISMRFDFLEYKRRSIYDQPFLSPKGKIRLPVPTNLIDAQSMDWGQVANGPLVGAAMESALDYAGHQAKTTDIDQITGSALAGGAIAGAEKSARDAGTDLNQLLQPTGMATNPFLTVLFKQPVFKTHSFSWTMIARDPAEALDIKGIVQTFRYHALPDVALGTAGTLLNYPDIVQPKFFQEDDYLYRFKPCVIKSVAANYAPSGPSFFKGSTNTPAEVELSIELMEIEYWTKVDFENDLARDNLASTENF
jgi:hypothetical protein